MLHEDFVERNSGLMIEAGFKLITVPGGLRTALRCGGAKVREPANALIASSGG